LGTMCSVNSNWFSESFDYSVAGEFKVGKYSFKGLCSRYGKRKHGGRFIFILIFIPFYTINSSSQFGVLVARRCKKLNYYFITNALITGFKLQDLCSVWPILYNKNRTRWRCSLIKLHNGSNDFIRSMAEYHLEE
jgi:hypothetical protein